MLSEMEEKAIEELYRASRLVCEDVRLNKQVLLPYELACDLKRLLDAVDEFVRVSKPADGYVGCR